MSPIELFMLYFAFMAPPFLVPINGLVFVVELVYVYYFSLIDHSGIKMTSIFPWQPDTMFHDDHHRLDLIGYFDSGLFLLICYLIMHHVPFRNQVGTLTHHHYLVIVTQACTHIQILISFIKS